MSKQANKTAIGAFVLTAMILIIIAVVAFGSGRFFKHTSKFVLYFEGSVKGLQVGAPVLFEGVKVGQVTDIALRFNPKDLAVFIPIYIEIDPATIKVVGGAEAKGRTDYIRPLIEKGLKAQLQIQSFVTGQLMISLAFWPEKQMHFVAAEDEHFPEIPTVPTDFQDLAKRLGELPLKEILDKLNNTLAGIEKIANSPKVQASLDSLDRVLKNVDKIIVQYDGLGPQTNKTLEDVSRMSRSLRSLADYLERHPEAILKGKSSKGE
jgi:paraquat-inducible protein B